MRPLPLTELKMRRGFTLIELLIVVVILGILATMGMHKFANTKERAIIAKMKGDLRNIVTAQEAYSSDHAAYYNGAVPSATLAYQPSAGVTIVISNVTATGWAATASSAAVTSRTCAIFYGTGGPIGPATVEGRVACT